MDVIILCGPPAAGKMTVGKELKALTGYKLLHNHMSLELVHQFFDFGTEHFRNLDKALRFRIFEEVARSSIEGFIFTMVWAFDQKSDEDYIDEIISVFEKTQARVCITELNCHLEQRLQRNRHPERLAEKPSKRDVEASEQRLLKHESQYRMQSLDNEFPDKPIFKVNNTHLTANATAMKIIQYFKLKQL